MQVNQVEDDIYLLIGEAYHSNSTAIMSGDDVLLIDAMGSKVDAAQLKQWIEHDLDKEVRFIVCTHYFCDHLAALNLFPGAKVIAHKNYLETFNSELYCSDEEKTHFREPDILVSDGLMIRWGKRTIDIFHNPGHTTSTLGIEIKDANLLLVGDTLVNNIVYLNYSTPERFVGALERLRSRAGSRVISSHGNVRSSEAIYHAQFYLESLGHQTRQARASSQGEQSLLQTPLERCLPPGIEATSFERIFHERNLHAILERKLFAAAGHP